MRSPHLHSHAKLALLLATVCVGACDCDERLRKALTDDSADRRMSDEPAAHDGPRETEPNNDQANATPLPIGRELREVRGEVALPDDVDWFALSAEGDESLEVTVTPDSMLDVALEVALPDGGVTKYDNGRRGDAEAIPVLRVDAGAQKFGVRSVGGSTGSYTIAFKRRLADATLEAEPNDDAAVATPFDVPGEIEGFFDRPSDRDIYVLRGVPGTPFDLELGAVSGVRQIATLFDDTRLSGPLLTVQIPEDLPARVPNLAIGPKGTLYLVLAPLGGANREQSYTLRATAHTPLAAGLLELEPNDKKPMAVTIDGTGHDVVLHGYLHAADDVDLFGLSAPAARPAQRDDSAAPLEAVSPLLAPYLSKPKPVAPISATLKWKDPNSTYGLQWTTSDGLQVEFRRDSPDPVVTACGMNLDAGESVLGVRVERLAAPPVPGEPQYTLTINDLSAAAAWEAEPNQTAAQADPLIDARRGTLGQYEDVDTYAFAVEAEADATRTVKLSATVRGTDTILRVTDDGGGVVANVDNGAVGSTETTTLDLPAGLYFVELRWKGGALCEPYTLTLEGGR